MIKSSFILEPAPIFETAIDIPTTRVSLVPDPVAAMLGDDACLVLADGAYTLEGGGAVLPALPDGDYPAELIGHTLAAELAGPLTVRNGQGTAPLRSVARTPVTLRFLVSDNQAEAPYQGQVELLAMRAGTATPDAVVTPAADGTATVALRPRTLYAARRATDEIDRVLTPSWRARAAPFEPMNGMAVVVAQRQWRLRLDVSPDLAGFEIGLSRGADTVPARLDGDGCAYVDAEPGAYRLACPGYDLSPDRVRIATTPSTVSVVAGPAAPDDPAGPEATVTLTLVLPDGETVAGQIVVTDANGAVSVIEAGRSANRALSLPPGPCRAKLVGHPRLDGTAALTVAPGGRGDLAIDARPGPRTRWLVQVGGGQDVRLADGTPLGMLLGQVGEPFAVPPGGICRAYVPMENGVIFTPPTDTAAPADLSFETDVTVSTDRRLVLAYADGWIHLIEPGTARIRAEPKAVYGETGPRLQVFAADLLNGGPVRLSNPRNVPRDELDRLFAGSIAPEFSVAPGKSPTVSSVSRRAEPRGFQRP